MYANKKNFLIVTASIGSGHNRAAQAIGKEIRSKYPQANIHIVDFMSTKTAYLNMLLKEAYLAMLNLLPDLYKLLYSWSGGRLKGVSIQTLLALAMKNDMMHLIKHYQADVVICTHPFPCAAAAYIKKNNKANILLAGVITDFAIHQVWVYKEVDMYFLCNASMGALLAEKGVESWRIFDTGIPIDTSFTMKYDKHQLAKEMNLDLNIPIVLVMGGGLGMGGVKMALTALETLKVKLQVLVVAGENHNLRAELRKIAESSKHLVRVWGFSDNIQELMAVATLLITKPGALTISEALAMELPMVLSEPIPGQEKENAEYIEATGTALWVKNTNELAKIIEQVILDNEILTKMRINARFYKRPYAAKTIVEEIERYLTNSQNQVSGM